jgi:hypothetical protein
VSPRLQQLMIASSVTFLFVAGASELGCGSLGNLVSTPALEELAVVVELALLAVALGGWWRLKTC